MKQLRGQDLKQAFSAATGFLEEYRGTVNALNVFPVPDGDTGTNMLLTMRSAVQAAAEDCPDGQDESVASVSAALAHGSFYGARGNSGVILSQFFKGFSEASAGKEVLTADDLALAFKLASEAAYKSVGNPVEGTILTVIRMASEAVQGFPGSVLDLWQTAFLASQDALSRTSRQLPVLEEAGVVDAGGLGIVVLIGGVLRSLSESGPLSSNHSSGGNYPGVDLSSLSRFQVVSRPVSGSGNGLVPTGPISLERAREQDWGFCTQFIINGRDLDPDLVRRHYQETALSAVVVGDCGSVRVHIHVEDPGPALSYAESLGALSETSIVNIDEQSQSFASGRQAKGAALALIPVAQGKGLAQLFQESGCAAVIEGGQTMNPSVEQIVNAARSTGASNVIILPNNVNVIFAAEQAEAAESFIHVVPAKSVPQGVAALLAYNPEGQWQQNIDAMTSAMSSVASVEVTTAVRDVKIGQLEVAEGQYIGLLEGKLITAADSPETALIFALEQAGLNANAIVTIYRGAGTPASDAQSAANELENAYPGLQVDLIDGGQPNYRYLGSVE